MAGFTIVKWTVTIFLVAICSRGIPPALGLTGNDDARVAPPVASVSYASALSQSEPYPSCRNPLPTEAAACRVMEQAILASTVRLVIYTKVMHIEGFGFGILRGNGHATIKDGRYLLTHNHYDEALVSLLRQGDPDDLVTVTVLDINGRTLLRSQGQTVSVPVVDAETILLDFGEKDGRGFFEALGLPSADFATSPFILLQPGMEVAQIDLEGSKSRVHWVNIEAIIEESGATVVQTSGCLNPGASGGGLFWQGHHIGNNWSTSEDCLQETSDGDAVHYGMVVLNPRAIAAP